MSGLSQLIEASGHGSTFDKQGRKPICSTIVTLLVIKNPPPFSRSKLNEVIEYVRFLHGIYIHFTLINFVVLILLFRSCYV